MPSETFYAILNDPDAVLELLEGIDAGIVVIDANYRVRMVNSAGRRIMDRNPNCLSGKVTCHSLFYDRDTPCEECPMSDEGLSGRHHSLTMKRRDGSEVFLKVFPSRWENHLVLTLHDVTRELSLLREVDLARRELAARNVRIERHSKAVADEKEELARLLDHLPDGLVTVDEDFMIMERNGSVSRLVPQPEGRSCFELLGRNERCPDCPVDWRVPLKPDASMKVSHDLGERYLTETITDYPLGPGAMLQFRDTTREIRLIDRIRKQQAAITGRNEMLDKLVGFTGAMPRAETLEEVVDHFVRIFPEMVPVDSMALLVNDVRPGSVWLTRSMGVDGDRMAALVRSYLDRDVVTSRSDLPAADVLDLAEEDVIVVDLVGGDGGRVGQLVLECGKQCRERDELIDLFTRPLGAFIHNRILLKKLEERANTDPLTGLYNRAFLEQVMEEEKRKLVRFSMPFSVVVADVNRLKMANDLYGHEAGDRLILTVSDLLRRNVRNTDLLARTGGDEFLILLGNTDDESARDFVRRLEKDVFNNVYMDVGKGEKFPVTVSFGAAGTDVWPVEELIAAADRLMYEAKEAFYRTEKRYR